MLFHRNDTPELIAGLDIGSHAVRLVAGQVSLSETGRPQIKIIGAHAAPSEGIQHGVVSSIEELISAISGSLEQVERMVGAPIDAVWVGVNGPFILTQDSKGVVAVAKTNGEISAEDTERVIEAARTVPMPLNYDILHVLPRSFVVDSQSGIKDPVGMTGMRLEADTKLVYGMTTHVKNLTRAVYRTGVDIEHTVLSILAAGEAVATPRQRELGVAVVNIGAASTSIAVYEEGVTMHVAVIPIGSQHITNDIAMGLRTGIDVAERIKVEYGHAVPKDVSKKEIIDLGMLGGDPRETSSRHYVAQIIEARVSEICEKVDKELMKIGKSGLLPAGIVFTGGGAHIGGLTDVAKDVLRLPASLGYAYDITSVANAGLDLGFATAIGLVKWGANSEPLHPKKTMNWRRAGALWERVQKAKQWLVP
jgi:cell division protein FtsA